MASSKKVLCPECKTNMKGVSAKSCKECSQKRFAEARRSAKGNKPEQTKPVVAKKVNPVETEVELPFSSDNLPPQLKIRIGDVSEDGKFYL